MKTILASILAVAFLASSPAFAGDKPAAGDKDKAAAGDKGDMKKKDDKKKDEKKDEKKAGGGW